jgi:hypothetical protein
MKNRGFATLIALLMLGIVAAAIVALLALLSIDARATARDAEEAQLRQLLVVGAADAKQKLDGGEATGTNWTVAVPQDLASDVHVEMSGDGDARQAVIVARRGARTMSQTIRFHRASGRWQAESAELTD